MPAESLTFLPRVLKSDGYKTKTTVTELLDLSGKFPLQATSFLMPRSRSTQAYTLPVSELSEVAHLLGSEL